MAKICQQCGLDKTLPEFRRKDTGPMAGFVFPTCIQCEGENALEANADVLRRSGYVCTAPFVVRVPATVEVKKP